MKSQRFGIEIELTGITREKAAQVIAEYFGTESSYIGGSYRAYQVKDGMDRIWKVMYDSSIFPQRKSGGILVTASDEYRTEIVSPILSYSDIESLQELVRRLRRGGAMANSTCGIHVHVDAAPHTPQTLKNLVNIIASKEDILYKALKIAPERLRYCKKTNEELIKTINARKPKSISELSNIWYQEDPYGRERHYNSTRYHGLNLHATFTKGTVEFRLFNSTTHAGEIKAYIQFCLAVSHQALIQKKASARKTVTDNEKYAFRCWMLRLGLNGDEFKTCRLHFLKNLEGNSAWRHVA